MEMPTCGEKEVNKELKRVLRSINKKEEEVEDCLKKEKWRKMKPAPPPFATREKNTTLASAAQLSLAFSPFYDSCQSPAPITLKMEGDVGLHLALALSITLNLKWPLKINQPLFFQKKLNHILFHSDS